MSSLGIKEHSIILKREHYDFNGYVTIYDFIVCITMDGRENNERMQLVHVSHYK